MIGITFPKVNCQKNSKREKSKRKYNHIMLYNKLLRRELKKVIKLFLFLI